MACASYRLHESERAEKENCMLIIHRLNCSEWVDLGWAQYRTTYPPIYPGKPPSSQANRNPSSLKSESRTLKTRPRSDRDRSISVYRPLGVAKSSLTFAKKMAGKG
ncbi:unnamed protein product [Tuber melanosporum]|uniref:(Perigord truffle) hypothetical protein n=1 Tax=Tuber melanosporum (strain Mel28) TaxID=656061 RepID=D5G4V7_TUBMM|nr:uncharacterized protein GSTUM_00000109001 [Tuber melanosporum]CAZ79550.1 unnamed protein product [Tuber melanosporum]